MKASIPCLILLQVLPRVVEVHTPSIASGTYTLVRLYYHGVWYHSSDVKHISTKLRNANPCFSSIEITELWPISIEGIRPSYSDLHRVYHEVKTYKHVLTQ